MIWYVRLHIVHEIKSTNLTIDKFLNQIRGIYGDVDKFAVKNKII